MRSAVFAVLLSLVCGVSFAGAVKPVTPADKRSFLKMVQELPTDGEFFTDKAIRKAAPHIAVLFALTEHDLGEMDIYPFAALARGLCDEWKYRQYAVDHFADIAHPMLKLFWAAILFEGQAPISSEVVSYLQQALASEKQSKELAEIVGPDFTNFKKHVTEYERPDK